MKLSDIKSTKFSNWFADSKISKNGKPIVLYHGTSKDVDFKHFKIPNQGVWFTKDPKEASQYALENDSQTTNYDGRNFVAKNTASRVIPVFIKAVNPKFFPSLPDELRFAGANSSSAVGYRKDQGLFWNKLKAEGHDAAVIGDFDLVVVFGSPNQIKSAIGNKDFDPTKKNIHEQVLLEKHEDITVALSKWKSPDIFITFSDLPKVGINPKSSFSTPIGIYAYPLQELWDNLLDETIPYAGERKWVHVLKAESIIDISEYTEEDLNRDVEKLKPILSKFMLERLQKKPSFSFSPALETVLDISVNNFINTAFGEAVPQTVTMSKLWNLTRRMAAYLNSKDESGWEAGMRSSPKWSYLLRYLGYDAISDKKGTGLIHPNEPFQAVFLNPKGFKHVASYLNIRKYDTTKPLEITSLSDLNQRISKVPVIKQQIKDILLKGFSRNVIAKPSKLGSAYDIRTLLYELCFNVGMNMKTAIELIIKTNSIFVHDDDKAYGIKTFITIIRPEDKLKYLDIITSDEKILTFILRDHIAERLMSRHDLATYYADDINLGFKYNLNHTQKKLLTTYVKKILGLTELETYTKQTESTSLTKINSPILIEKYEDITSILAKWKDDPDIFITFTNLPKVGINPKSSFKTPTGVYAYPLKEMWTDILTYNIPFAGDRKWIHVLRAKSIIDVSEYSEENLKNDVDRIKQILTKFMYDHMSQEDTIRPSAIQFSKLEINVRDFINKSLSTAYPKNIPMAKIWNLTRETAAYLKTSDGLPSSLSAPKWTALMLFLGFGAISDRKGIGLIHTNEPKQAVFFNPKYYQVIGSFRNIRKNHSDASHVIQIRDFDELNNMLVHTKDATPENLYLLYNQIRDLIKKGKSRNYYFSSVDIRQSYMDLVNISRMLLSREKLSAKEIVSMIFNSIIIDNETKAYSLKRLIYGFTGGLDFLKEVVKNPNVLQLILKYTRYTKEEFVQQTKKMWSVYLDSKEMEKVNLLLSKI